MIRTLFLSSTLAASLLTHQSRKNLALPLQTDVPPPHPHRPPFPRRTPPPPATRRARAQVWTNVCVDVGGLVRALFGGARLATIDRLELLPSVRLRRVFAAAAKPALRHFAPPPPAPPATPAEGPPPPAPPPVLARERRSAGLWAPPPPDDDAGGGGGCGGGGSGCSGGGGECIGGEGEGEGGGEGEGEGGGWIPAGLLLPRECACVTVLVDAAAGWHPGPEPGGPGHARAGPQRAAGRPGEPRVRCAARPRRACGACGARAHTHTGG
jgi:hypothetical protein